MPGSGKTSVGKKLQWLSARRCVDTDEMIEKEYGKISEIFEKNGEEYFRNLETKTAEFLSKKDKLIISTGGGFVMREENVAFLKKNGKIFYLRAGLSSLLERVSGNDCRPLLRGDPEGKLKALIAERAPVYERVADHIVDTDGRTVADISKEILSFIGA
jgi:shikimate kinase